MRIIILMLVVVLAGCEDRDRTKPVDNDYGLRTICFDGVQYIKYIENSLTVKYDKNTLLPATCTIYKRG